MTRKKFVKQVMALGYQRNEAQRLAEYARRGFWTYEQYLEIEKRYHGQVRAFENVKISLVDHMTPALKAAAQVVENMRRAIEGAMSQTPFGKALLDWTRENVPQSNEQHPADALDAMVYALDPLQIIEQEPAQEWTAQNPYLAHHGYVCGIDLANGPDFTAGGGGHE